MRAGLSGFLCDSELPSIRETDETIHELIKHNMLHSRACSYIAQDDLDSNTSQPQ